ncbi:MAG: hypothetical protein BroJett040_06770 [Oligoflexia bacterium]|nr:MAG: hypothetical protein BroJett040_06770 [Oligoflexia bacterium]
MTQRGFGADSLAGLEAAAEQAEQLRPAAVETVPGADFAPEKGELEGARADGTPTAM